MKNAIELYSIYRLYYYELYTIYKGCNEKPQIVDAIRKSYIKNYRKDPEKENINLDQLLNI